MNWFAKRGYDKLRLTLDRAFLNPSCRLANLSRPARADSLEEEGANPLARVMKKYVGTGPYSLLYRLHDEKRRANVMIRRVNR